MVAAVTTAWLLLWAAACAQSGQDFYDFKAVNIRGKLVSLEKYRGSVSDSPLRTWRGWGRGLPGWEAGQGPRGDATLGRATAWTLRASLPRDPCIRRSLILAYSGLWLRGTAQEPPR